jgi:hypothetical protein
LVRKFKAKIILDMKQKLFLSYIIVALFLLSCKKDIPGNTFDSDFFYAQLASSNITIGDSAKFILTENPDIITFFSGEIGHEYKNRNRTVLEGGSLKMKFQTRVTNLPADTLDVMISNDFSGIYDSTNVANAHWTKLTDSFKFPDPAATLGIFYPSGLTDGQFLDITSFTTAGKPFYVAYKYDYKAPTNIIWSIAKLGMYNIFPSSFGVANATVIDSTQINSGSFGSVQFNDPVSRWSTSSTYLKCTNSLVAPIGAQYWYISRALNSSAVAPDLPLIIKNITESPLKNFEYKYSKPGIYTASIVASYQRLNYEKTFVKEFTIIVQ